MRNNQPITQRQYELKPGTILVSRTNEQGRIVYCNEDFVAVSGFATCQRRLVSFFYNIINISANHFNHEESIILRCSHVNKKDEDFHLHQQAHDNILQKLKAVVSECASHDAQGETAEAYRQLYRKILEQFEEHDRLFDSRYINWSTSAAH